MKTILITIFLASAICCQAQTSYDRKQDVKTAMIQNWQKIVDAKLMSDSVTIAFLQSQVNILTNTQSNQTKYIGSLQAQASALTQDIATIQSVNITQQVQIWSLQDSLKFIPFMLVDTTIHVLKPYLQFRNNTLKVVQ